MVAFQAASALIVSSLLCSPCFGFYFRSTTWKNEVIQCGTSICVGPSPIFSKDSMLPAFGGNRFDTKVRAAESGGMEPESEGLLNKRSVAIGITWLSLLAYVAFFSPQSTGDAGKEMVREILLNSSNPNVNPLFALVFNYLGVLPLVYLGVLIPGSKNQRVPGILFILSSLYLGFFALGPYLALREYRTEREKNPGLFIRAFKNPFYTVVPATLFWRTLSLFVPKITLDPTSTLEGFKALFLSSQLAQVSTIDLCILSVMFFDVVVEDMKRSNLYTDGNLADLAKAIAFCIPFGGPVLYLVFRSIVVVEDDYEQFKS